MFKHHKKIDALCYSDVVDGFNEGAKALIRSFNLNEAKLRKKFNREGELSFVVTFVKTKDTPKSTGASHDVT